ncbi:MAG: AbrB/MazE/SpoVT family DNA-binding domain-containing protein [Promethearchaeota archaeon]
MYREHIKNIKYQNYIMALIIEHRKVQQTGGSSFIISLPKEWIKKHEIKKNDPLKL